MGGMVGYWALGKKRCHLLLAKGAHASLLVWMHTGGLAACWGEPLECPARRTPVWACSCCRSFVDLKSLLGACMHRHLERGPPLHSKQARPPTRLCPAVPRVSSSRVLPHPPHHGVERPRGSPRPPASKPRGLGFPCAVGCARPDALLRVQGRATRTTRAVFALM